MKIAFVYTEGRLRRLDRVLRGESPSDFFYGALELSRRGHGIEYLEASYRNPRRVAQRCLEILRRQGLLPTKLYGGLLLNVGRLVQRLSKVDVVVGTTPGIAFSLAIWKQLGAFRAPIVGIQTGLLNYPCGWIRHRLNRYLLHRMWSQLVGLAEFEDLCRIYHLPRGRVMVNQRGIDTGFWSPGPDEDGQHVLAVGNDGRRDYELLMEVTGSVDFPFMVVTNRTIRAAVPPQVNILKGSWRGEEITDGALRELYRGARCVVIPLVETLQPSGQSVCLQAMACAKPVVLTRTKGLWSTSMIRDGENILFVPPGDAAALRGAIQALLQDRERRRRIGAAARATVQAEADIQTFAERTERLCLAASAAGR